MKDTIVTISLLSKDRSYFHNDWFTVLVYNEFETIHYDVPNIQPSNVFDMFAGFYNPIHYLWEDILH